MSIRIRIGTRGSKLALWQAHYVKNQLETHGYEVTLDIIKTKGDQIQHLSFDKIEGKGFFTEELEAALLSGQIDMAVHSMKDLPTEMKDGLIIAGVSERADPADWLLIRKDRYDAARSLGLPMEAIVGTSSNRRKAQINYLRNDLQVRDLRGNVPTRLRKLAEGQYDGIILAAAGLTRLEIDLSEFAVKKLHPREFVPAPAQGVLAYQINGERQDMRSAIKQIHQRKTSRVTNVERKVLKMLQGGCHLPLGVYCEQDDAGYFHVWAAYASTVKDDLRHAHISYNTTDGLAEAVVNELTKT